MLYTLWTVFRKSWKKHNFLQWHKLCPLCENVSLVISMGIGSEKVSVFSPLQLTSMCSYHKRYWTLHLLITSPLLHFLYALCPFLFLRRNKQKLVSFVFSMLISIHAVWKVYCYFSRFTMQKTDGRAPSFSRQQYECIGVTSENDFFSVAARQKHRLSSSYWLFFPPTSASFRRPINIWVPPHPDSLSTHCSNANADWQVNFAQERKKMSMKFEYEQS